MLVYKLSNPASSIMYMFDTLVLVTGMVQISFVQTAEYLVVNLVIQAQLCYIN